MSSNSHNKQTCIDMRVYEWHNTLIVYELLNTYTRMRGYRMHTNDDGTEVFFNNRDPVYLQVVRHFKEQIATGRMEAGQVIPSRRELAALFKINPNTAQRAYKEMEEQQLIVTEGNSPSRITNQVEILKSIRSELLHDTVTAFISSIRKIEVPIEELLDLVQREFVEARKHESAKISESDGGRND